MLAVGVEGEDRLGAALEGVPEPGPKRGALALVRTQLEDRGAGAARPIGVPSDEPSSITMTGRCSRAAVTTAPIRGASL